MRCLIGFFLLSICTSVPAQHVPPASSAPSTTIPWSEGLRRATVCLGSIDESNGTRRFRIVGTGVIVSPDWSHAFIVTAKHVFDQPDRNWHPQSIQVRFTFHEGKSFKDEIGAKLDLLDGTKTLWSALDDGSDIAAIPMTASFASVYIGRPVTAVVFSDFAVEDDVFEGASVITFGFPGEFAKPLIGSEGLVRAITRSGIIAWTDPQGPMDHPLLLDSNVLPGNSGGPVFRVPTGLDKYGNFGVRGKTSFLGVVTLDITQKISSPGASAEVYGVGALGRVEPASKVRKLIEQLLVAPLPPPAHETSTEVKTENGPQPE